jgi:hypothetical protein
MTIMGKSWYYFKAGSLVFFSVCFLLILLIGPVMHNHSWQLVEPNQCPAFLLEQVLSAMVKVFLLVMMISLSGSSSFAEFYLLPPRRVKLSFIQTNRPPPVTFSTL